MRAGWIELSELTETIQTRSEIAST